MSQAGTGEVDRILSRAMLYEIKRESRGNWCECLAKGMLIPWRLLKEMMTERGSHH